MYTIAILIKQKQTTQNLFTLLERSLLKQGEDKKGRSGQGAGAASPSTHDTGIVNAGHATGEAARRKADTSLKSARGLLLCVFYTRALLRELA